jgi:hypothetical protein
MEEFDPYSHALSVLRREATDADHCARTYSAIRSPAEYLKCRQREADCREAIVVIERYVQDLKILHGNNWKAR